MRLDGQHRAIFASRGLLADGRLADMRKHGDHADQRSQEDDLDVHNEPFCYSGICLLTLSV